MERLGYPPETRPFSPHLTVGRVQDHVASQDLNKLRAALEENQVGALGSLGVEDLHLMKSDLQPGGPVYSTLFTAPLARSDSNHRGDV
jgi:2'-5' RNA ligase